MVDRGEVQRFVSRPDLIPPKITVVRRSPGTAPGLLFLGPSSGPGQRGAMIIDDAGELVWFRPTVPASVINLRADDLPRQAGAHVVGGQDQARPRDRATT